jgi:hypothetical protein
MRQSTKIHTQHQGLQMLFYRAALPLSSRTLNYAAGVIRRHRKSTGSCWRKLNPGRQALLVLAYLRKGETFADLAAGFEVGTTTAWRYVNETTELLAARAPKLRQAIRDAVKAGWAYVVIDGTLIPADRVAADRPFYSGKHKRHGMNLQVISSPVGDILWVSGALPGAVHDKEAEWIWGVLAELEAVGLVTLAIRATRAARTRRSPTGAGTSRNPRKKPTAPTRSSAPPASARTPSSRPGESCASSAAAPGAPASWPRPSTHCRFTAHKQDGKGSISLGVFIKGVLDSAELWVSRERSACVDEVILFVWLTNEANEACWQRIGLPWIWIVHRRR